MRIDSRLGRVLATLVCCAAAEAAAAVSSRDIDIGPMPSFVHLDPVTQRVFTVNPGRERFFASGTYSVLAPDGRVTTAEVSGALASSFSTKWRTLAIARMDPQQIVLVNADTLERTAIAMPFMPSKVAIAEATGKVYAIGAKPLAALPWLVPGTMSGYVGEIDPATKAVRVGVVEGFQPRHLAVDAAGARAFVAGVNYFRTGEETPGFLRVFDTASLAPMGALLDMGRRPEMMLLSRDGRSLYVGTHMDWTYPEGTSMMPRHIRAALVVVDTATMAGRLIPLPIMKDLNLHSGVMQGQLAEGRTRDTLYLNDQDQFRLFVVDVAAGSVREVAMEDFGRAVAYNPVTDNVLVALPRQAAVAVFSAAGDRLDTVPAGSPTKMGVGPPYSIAIDERNGDAYVANPHDASISVLHAVGEPGALVNMTDLWWNPEQSGWGVFIDQQGLAAFAALFVQDADGHPGWYVMPQGRRQGDGSFAGTLLRTTGPVASALANASAVGTMRIAAEMDGGSFLSYQIDGKAVATPIVRQRFTAAPRSCGWSVGTAKSANANYTALWFDAAQPGWGLALSQQGDTAFGVLFTYDAAQRPTWTTMSAGQRSGAKAFQGPMHRIGIAQSVKEIGTMALAFDDAAAGTLTYAMGAATVTQRIERQRFAPLVTECAGP